MKVIVSIENNPEPSRSVEGNADDDRRYPRDPYVVNTRERIKWCLRNVDIQDAIYKQQVCSTEIKTLGGAQD